MKEYVMLLMRKYLISDKNKVTPFSVTPKWFLPPSKRMQSFRNYPCNLLKPSTPF